MGQNVNDDVGSHLSGARSCIPTEQTWERDRCASAADINSLDFLNSNFQKEINFIRWA